MIGTIHPTTRHYASEDLNPQPHYLEKFKSHDIFKESDEEGVCYQHSDRLVYIATCSGTEVTVGVSVCKMSHTNSLYLDMGTEDLGLDGSGSSPGFL
jgi:hypothetical protein